jgi:O-methyltransferase
MLKLLKRILRKLNLLPFFYHNLNSFFPTFESLNPANLQALKTAFKVAPPGDYYEFGVYKGFSFWFALQIAEIQGKNSMHFYGFDSFDGLPTPRGVDLSPDSNGNTFARGNFCAGLKYVEDMMMRYGADKNKFTFIKGFFKDTLTPDLFKKHQFKKAGIILIDCDLYESTRTVLNFILNILQNGTIILFDDWGLTEKNRGQQLAFKEWKKSHPNYKFKECCDFNLGKGFTFKGVSFKESVF